MRAVEDTLSRIAASDLPVLISGETGVGKEIAARLLHARSPRAAEPIRRGQLRRDPRRPARERALRPREGRFHRRASPATPGMPSAPGAARSFLDEIGDMPLHMQAKLLRLIEDGFFLRVGGETPVPFRARVVSATHHDLDVTASAGPLPPRPAVPAERGAGRYPAAAGAPRRRGLAAAPLLPSGDRGAARQPLAASARSPRRPWRPTLGPATCGSCATASTGPSRSPGVRC